MPVAYTRGWALVHAGGDARREKLGPVSAHRDLYNCLLSALFLSVCPLLSSSAQNTDSFTVSDA